MQRQMLKSKIHRATVTGCDADHIGSVTVDADLLERADIPPNEPVHVWDISNGAHMVTYALEGERGTYAPLVVHVDEDKRTVEVDSHPEVLLSAPAEVLS